MKLYCTAILITKLNLKIKLCIIIKIYKIQNLYIEYKFMIFYLIKRYRYLKIVTRLIASESLVDS